MGFKEKLTEEKALAILASNLKRKKRNVDMLTISECIDYLRELYGSLREVERRAGVSSEMLREFLLVKKLVERLPNLQRRIELREIDSVEVVEEIWKVKGIERQKELVENIARLKLATKDVRSVVQYVNASPNLSIENCIRRVLESKAIVEKRFMVVMELKNSTLEGLRKEAEKLSVSVEDLARSILENLKIKDIISYDMRGKLIALTVLEDGLKVLKEKAKELKIALEDLAETIINDWMVRKIK